MDYYIHKNKQAFTLIELIIVIAIIALLAAAVFVAVDPAKRIGEARDAQRWKDITALAKAVETYTADNADLPSDLSTTTIGYGDKVVLCDSASTLTCDDQTRTCLEVDDTDFVGVYIGDLPVDPSKSDASDTGYYLSRTEGGTITVGVCDPYTSDTVEVASAIPSTFSVSCDGWYYKGYCWYMGSVASQSCNTVCTTHGGCIAENWNDDSSCNIGYHFTPGADSCSEISLPRAPYKLNNDLYYRDSAVNQDCSSNGGGYERFCACTN